MTAGSGARIPQFRIMLMKRRVAGCSSASVAGASFSLSVVRLSWHSRIFGKLCQCNARTTHRQNLRRIWNWWPTVSLCTSALFSFLLPSSFVICLTTPEEDLLLFFLSKALVYYCFLVFRRTGLHISPELFYFVSLTGTCSLTSLYHAQARGSCQTTLYSGVRYRMAVCIAVSTQLYGSIGYSCVAVSRTVWQCV